MTAAATDEYWEDPPVTATPPEPAFPIQAGACVHADPWWRGVSGIDPLLPAADWRWVAMIAATALAARFLTLKPRGSRMFNARPAVYAITADWRAWLADATSSADYYHRITALRLVLEHQDADRDDALDVASALYAAVTR